MINVHFSNVGLVKNMKELLCLYGLDVVEIVFLLHLTLSTKYCFGKMN